MRAFVLFQTVLLASVGASLAVWSAVESRSGPWCELVDETLIRTTATESQVNQAVAEVMTEVRLPRATPEGGIAQSGYRERAACWFKQGVLVRDRSARLTSLTREELDTDGRRLLVKTLQGPEMPTLVFVEHESTGVPSTIARRIARRIEALGVKAR